MAQKNMELLLSNILGDTAIQQQDIKDDNPPETIREDRSKDVRRRHLKRNNMKMKKLLSVAVLLILMATPLVLASCSNDDLTEDIEDSGTKLDVWIEPCHIKGANQMKRIFNIASQITSCRQVSLIILGTFAKVSNWAS